MPTRPPVSPETFAGIQNVDIDRLSELPESAVRPILPCLVRMSLCAPLDTSSRWTLERKKILKCLSGIEVVNSLVGLLSIDFHELEQDARKEQQLRAKMGGSPTESLLIAQLEQGIALEFERCDAARKLRLLLSEVLFIMYQMKEAKNGFYEKSSELFESEVYLEEVSDVLCIAQAELPSLLPITDVAEALLHVQNGSWLLCRVVANSPDSFIEVCTCLIANGEAQDEETLSSRRRSEALIMLCDMTPSQVLSIRSLCVEHCQQPGLAVRLTLRHNCKPDNVNVISSLVAFVSGLLLDNDANVRNWFAQFVRAGQKRNDTNSAVHALRLKLLEELKEILKSGSGEVSQHRVVQGCAFIRLYSALKCIAGLKFTEEENNCLLQLVISRPPMSDSGIRFICLGLCMLLACPHLLGNPEQEKQAIEWIKWLVEEAEQYEQSSDVKASFGEMLLLIAIHFHSNQNNAIVDLVSSTLGMKSAVKSNALARMKTIFTQDIFTEQVVTSHAVKVAVTDNLNANISGYLPVHCIYQLLRSRAFSKHKVSIKDWIFKQLCHCSTPIHPLIPPLIDVFINSIILPSGKADRTNDPITEEEILRIFKGSFVGARGRDDGSSKEKNQSEDETMDFTEECSSSTFTTQILFLYYLLMYHDTLLNNMKSIVAWNRPIYKYSERLMSRLPMKYLLQQAQEESSLYVGVYSSLLRLLATHYPHYCLVSDWMIKENVDLVSTTSILSLPQISCNEENLRRAFERIEVSPGECILLLEELSVWPSTELMPYCSTIVGSLPCLLESHVPRRCQDLVHQIWLKINNLQPMSLRVMTVNALRSSDKGGAKVVDYSEDDITVNPLIVLRCADRVFRCPPLLDINLRVLEAFLQASKSFLTSHIQMNPVVEKSSQDFPLTDREELRMALVAAQESAAIQIILECCLPKDRKEKVRVGLLSDLREIQGLVCSFLHQMFISDPNLAKLVHFQGYPTELIPLTVAGIPSMHICVDFIPELIAQPHLDKQMFAIELVSYLSLQYALPKAMGVAKLAVDVMNTMLSVLPRDKKPYFFLVTLPALVRVCKAFPPLCEDAVALLLQLGRMVHSHLSTLSTCINVGNLFWDSDDISSSSSLFVESKDFDASSVLYLKLSRVVRTTFREIVGSTTLLQQDLTS